MEEEKKAQRKAAVNTGCGRRTQVAVALEFLRREEKVRPVIGEEENCDLRMRNAEK